MKYPCVLLIVSSVLTGVARGSTDYLIEGTSTRSTTTSSPFARKVGG